MSSACSLTIISKFCLQCTGGWIYFGHSSLIILNQVMQKCACLFQNETSKNLARFSFCHLISSNQDETVGQSNNVLDIFYSYSKLDWEVVMKQICLVFYDLVIVSMNMIIYFHTYLCLRPKARDLEIISVVLVVFKWLF